ncbi:hypothetical protein C499_00650 [Halogeometricum borinquense DSM 11551]|uniref:Uncharacterized protein n=1 Tax=Halogeometricum borinquense (strain ATCC 700274 / DSM 11551 / JCM 10706 / KCTC 4070 / PR3) TaxID=469382 RepID=E4NVY7_HALBP|nr:hypothetical protein [Halogeometricum borinquense]ADQ69207.1 hypothetical protein Hbor_38930 [Halogeometricum borinquense DSM 11551]ELY31510.1 hypothetical protein C499_00650 [Halogeometricum borinquense DSM 11551]
MKGEIEGITDDGIGVRVIDKNGFEHKIEMLFDGEIVYHHQKGYPDNPKERTNEEDESVAQARRFARYHVYREKGYDTVPNPDNPDRIAAVLLALIGLDDQQFDQYFGMLYEQMASHERADVAPVLDLPQEVYSEEFIVYKQNVYLEESLDAMQDQLTQPATEVFGEENLQEFLQETGDGLVAKARSLVGGGTDEDEDASEEPSIPEADLSIADVSGLDTMYSTPEGYKTIEGEDPVSREPDARIETLPMGYTREQFRYHVGHNLICQIRDCFISMGVEPPAQYRLLGHGKFKYSAKYRDFDFYPDYWDYEANIPGYSSPV